MTEWSWLHNTLLIVCVHPHTASRSGLSAASLELKLVEVQREASILHTRRSWLCLWSAVATDQGSKLSPTLPGVCQSGRAPLPSC